MILGEELKWGELCEVLPKLPLCWFILHHCFHPSSPQLHSHRGNPPFSRALPAHSASGYQNSCIC